MIMQMRMQKKKQRKKQRKKKKSLLERKPEADPKEPNLPRALIEGNHYHSSLIRAFIGTHEEGKWVKSEQDD